MDINTGMHAYRQMHIHMYGYVHNDIITYGTYVCIAHVTGCLDSSLFYSLPPWILKFLLWVACVLEIFCLQIPCAFAAGIFFGSVPCSPNAVVTLIIRVYIQTFMSKFGVPTPYLPHVP